MTRPIEYGVAHSDGLTVMFGFSARVYPMSVVEGRGNREPGELDREIKECRDVLDSRRAFVVIAEGSRAFLEAYRRGIREADYIFYCSDEETLKALGVEVVDRNWSNASQQIDADKYIDARFHERQVPIRRSLDEPGAPSEATQANDVGAVKGVLLFALGVLFGRRSRGEQ